MTSAVQLAIGDAPVQLTVGDEVWCLICGDETGDKGRRTVKGTGFGCIEERADVGDSERYVIRLQRASATSGHMVGRTVTIRRADLYARRSRAEHAAFGATVRRFWGSNDPMKSPPCEHDWMALVLGTVFCRKCSAPLPADAPRCRGKHSFYFAHCGHETCMSCGFQRNTDKPMRARAEKPPPPSVLDRLITAISTSTSEDS